MDDVLYYFLGPPHSTTTAAVTTNKNTREALPARIVTKSDLAIDAVQCSQYDSGSPGENLRKWLGIPLSFKNIGLYWKTNKLQLPLSSLVKLFKTAKTRLVSTLRDLILQTNLFVRQRLKPVLVGNSHRLCM